MFSLNGIAKVDVLQRKTFCRRYIRSTLGTICRNGEGANWYEWHHRIQSGFKARQESRAVALCYLIKSRKKGGDVIRTNTRYWIKFRAAQSFMKVGYPVVMSFRLEPGGGHSAVGRKYKAWYRNVRRCRFCSWRKVYKYEFYLHYGWGGSNNKWQAINPYTAHIAYIKKDVTVENKEQKQKQFCLCRGCFLTNEM